MKFFVLFALSSMAFAYDDLDDSIDVEALAKDIPNMKKYIHCHLDIGGCSDISLPYKNYINDILDKACENCNDRQRHIIRVFIKSVKENFPEEYEQYFTRYDQTRQKFPALEAALEKY